MDRIERQARELGDSVLAERQQQTTVERRTQAGALFGCALILATAAFILWAGYHAG